MPKTYIITITSSGADEMPTTHYLRRVAFDDLAPVIRRFDESLNVRARKRRSDAGTSKAA